MNIVEATKIESLSTLQVEPRSEDWEELADIKTIMATTEALRSRGINVEFASTKEQALQLVGEIIPAGAEVMTAGSESLREIGFIDLLKSGKHQWKNIKDQLFAEKDPAKKMDLRKKSVTAEYFLGSVHAVAQTGEIIIASGSGSQIPSYAFSSRNVVWVVGTQKIVTSLEEGLKRVREHSLPLEDVRMKSMGYPGSAIGKLLIFEREMMPDRKIILIFVDEKLGF